MAIFLVQGAVSFHVLRFLLGVETCTERTSKAFLVWRTLPRVCPTAAMWPAPSSTISPGLTSNRQNYLTGGTCISEGALTQGPRQPAAEGLTLRRRCVRRIDLATPSGTRRQGPIRPRPSTLCWPLPSSGSGECQGGRRCSSSSEPGRIGCRRAPTCLPTGEAQRVAWKESPLSPPSPRPRCPERCPAAPAGPPCWVEL